MPRSKPQPRNITARGGRLTGEHKTSREARRAARGAPALTFFERRASTDPAVDHESHSMGWAGRCMECPSE